MIGRRPLVGLAAGGLAALPQAGLAQAPAPAWPQAAAIRAGTRTLPDRILTAATATLRAQPAAQAAPVTAMPPLTPLYVYERRAGADQRPWLLVGRGAAADAMGWMPATEAFAWPHPLTARLHAPEGRAPLALFREPAGLDATLAQPDPEAAATALAQAAPNPPLGFPLTAVEAPDALRRARQDYLLPVLSAQRAAAPLAHRRLELAALAAAGPVPPRPYALGIAIVVDTSASMDPYIEKVRSALTALVQAAPQRNSGPVRFALIGFRNSLVAQPRLEYVTRIFATFADSEDPELLTRRMAEVHATTVDSLSFNEDSYAGLQVALTQLDWTGIDGRAVVLVTDAGSRTSDDPLSSTGFTEDQMGALAQSQKAAVLALHLRTPAGRGNHAWAERQYKAVTRRAAPNGQPQYYPVGEGRLGELGVVMGQLLADLIELVRDAPPPPPNPPPVPALPLSRILPLTWVRRPGLPATLPEVVRGWASDGWRGAVPGEVAALHLLLTLPQLEELATRAETVARYGRGYAPHPAGFFPLLAQAGLLPGDPATTPLGEAFGEAFAQLPYPSEVAALDHQGWITLRHRDRLELLDRLGEKAQHYRRFLADPQGWHLLADTEKAYPVPLETLP